jgi:hypothetical protein
LEKTKGLNQHCVASDDRFHGQESLLISNEFVTTKLRSRSVNAKQSRDDVPDAKFGGASSDDRFGVVKLDKAEGELKKHLRLPPGRLA